MKRRSKGQKRKYVHKKHWEEHIDFPEAEEKWKDNFWKIKPIDFHLNLDTDRDGVKDCFDCRPFDPTRQDNMMTPVRPDIQRPMPPSMPTHTAPPETVRSERVEGPVNVERPQTKLDIRSYPKTPTQSPTINPRPLPPPLSVIQKPTILPPKGTIQPPNVPNIRPRIDDPRPRESPVNIQTGGLPRGTYVEWQYPAMQKGSPAFDNAYKQTLSELETGKLSGKYDVNAQVGVHSSRGYTYFSIRTLVGYPV